MKDVKMRQIDRIQNMSLNELAEFLIHTEVEDVGDFDWDENPIPLMESFWLSPSGNQFPEDDYEAAVADAVEWLESEYIPPDMRG